MSRHVLRNDLEYEVVVGYDDPLDTFFSQVYDVPAGNKADDDVLIVQTGTMSREVTDAAECLRSVAGHVDVPDGMAAVLEDERRHRREPTQFQRETFRAILGKDLP